MQDKFRTSIHSSEYTKLRKILIEKRKNLKLSQRGLAKLMNVNYSLIGKIETGDRRLDIFELIKYCEALNCNINDLIKDILQ